MDHRSQLRPIERRILRLEDEGRDAAEIAERFRRTPEFVNRVSALAHLDRAGAVGTRVAETLRPIERRVLQWRAAGVGYAEIALKFKRSPAFVERVERLAKYKLTRV